MYTPLTYFRNRKEHGPEIAWNVDKAITRKLGRAQYGFAAITGLIIAHAGFTGIEYHNGEGSLLDCLRFDRLKVATDTLGAVGSMANMYISTKKAPEHVESLSLDDLTE